MYLYHEDAFPQSVYRKKVLSMLLSISNKIHFTYQYVHVHCTNLHCKENCNKGESHNKEQHHEHTYNVLHGFIHYTVNLKIHKRLNNS